MKNKRILLVDPPGWQGAVHGNAAFPNVGIAYLAAVLKKMNWDVIVSDMNNSQSAIDNFTVTVQESHPDIIGFSCKTSTFLSAKALALQIRKKYGNTIKLFFGGPHITLNYRELSVSEENYADLLFVGEGEVDFAAVCESFLHDSNDIVLQNGSFYQEGKIKVYLPENKINIEDLPFPDYSVFNENVLAHIKDHYPLFTSRGCPYECIYCTVPLINGRKWRFRSVKSIIDELCYAQEKYGITGFQIVDDSWNVDMERCKEMCRKILEEKIKLSWYCPNGIRADRVDKDLATLMFDAGCNFVAVGLESGCQKVFQGIKKSTTLEKIESGIKILQSAGLKVSAFFIIGLPNDSPKGVMESVKLAKKLSINAFFNILVPYRHTEVYRLIADKGRLLFPQEEALHFSSDLKKLNASFEWNDFSANKMKKCYIKAHLELKMYSIIIQKRHSFFLWYLDLILLFLKYNPLGFLKVIKAKLFLEFYNIFFRHP